MGGVKKGGIGDVRVVEEGREIDKGNKEGGEE